MAWQIRFDDASKKDLAKLDRPVAKRITEFLRTRVTVLEDPRSLASALHDPTLGGFGSTALATIGLFAVIEDSALRVLVVKNWQPTGDLSMIPKTTHKKAASLRLFCVLAQALFVFDFSELGVHDIVRWFGFGRRTSAFSFCAGLCKQGLGGLH